MKARKSTLIMSAAWIALVVLYFLVRPTPPEPMRFVPFAPSVTAPASTSETPTPTTAAPSSTPRG